MNDQSYTYYFKCMMTFLIYSLYYNDIGTEAAVALSVAMETMSNLQYLE